MYLSKKIFEKYLYSKKIYIHLRNDPLTSKKEGVAALPLF